MFHFSTEEVYEDGQIIFEEGNSGDWIYVIQEGAVEISKAIQDEEVIIEILKTGEVFGELGFITNTKDCSLLRRTSYQQTLVDGIAKGINTYISKTSYAYFGRNQ